MLIAVIVVVPIFTYAVLPSSLQSSAVSVTINGNRVNFSGQQPVIVNDRVLVPVRGVFEYMGFQVTWYENARVARMVNHNTNTVVIIPADLNSFVVNGMVITPDVPQRIVNDRLMLPVRAVSEALGGTVTWDSANRVASVFSVVPTPTPSPVPGFDYTPGYIDYSVYGVRHINELDLFDASYIEYDLNGAESNQ